MLQPIDSPAIDEIQYQIDWRKRVLQEGEAFYNAIDGVNAPYFGVSNTNRSIDTSKILHDISQNQTSFPEHYEVHEVREEPRQECPTPTN